MRRDNERKPLVTRIYTADPPKHLQILDENGEPLKASDGTIETIHPYDEV